VSISETKGRMVLKIQKKAITQVPNNLLYSRVRVSTGSHVCFTTGYG